MKKYRLTKITVKTREIISLSKDSTEEMHISVCPICHSPFPASLPKPDSTAATIIEMRTTELAPAEISGEQD